MIGRGPSVERIIQGVILAMAGAAASLGMTFGCMIRNIILWPSAYAHNVTAYSDDLEGHMRGTGIGDMLGTVFLAALMLIWIWAVSRFVRQEPRSVLTWVLTLPILAIFAWMSWQTWKLAYPVCNAM